MAWYPHAIRKELPQARTQPTIQPVGVVLHTAVSNGSSLYDYFNGRSGGIEAHFYLREDGSFEQYMPTTVRADCQLDGNSWLDGSIRKGFISVESWDGYPNGWANDSDVPPWNLKQLVSLAALLAWLSKTHGIPLEKATGPHGVGIGWHRQFTNTSPYKWNQTHACPGDRRIAQIPGLTGDAKSQLEESDDMPTAKEIVDEWMARQTTLTDGEIKRGHYTDALGDDKALSNRSLEVHAAIGGRQVGEDVLPRLDAIEATLSEIKAAMAGKEA